MLYRNIYGVPDFECTEYAGKTKDYVLLIPIINEGERITRELSRAKEHGISAYADIVICDGGSTDGCTDEARLRALDVNTLPMQRMNASTAAMRPAVPFLSSVFAMLHLWAVYGLYLPAAFSSSIFISSALPRRGDIFVGVFPFAGYARVTGISHALYPS